MTSLRVLLTCLVAVAAGAASSALPASPAKIDLNAFDALKKTIALPNGEVLAYIEMGNPAGRPVVMVHGYGQSGKPECCYNRLDFAYDIKLLLDALHLPKADFVGHSLGTIIIQTFAEYWPERTGRIVLISSTGGMPPDAPKKPPQFDFAAAIRNLKEPIEADSPFMIAWWDSPTPVDPDFIARERKDAAAIPLRVWLAVLDQTLAGDNYADLQRTLPRLKAPTLLIWGSKDTIMEEPMRKSLRDALPNAQVKIFAGLGHNPFWEDPAGVARVINAFLLSA
jgi:pimeloyl-ACP methyl ester carboxylesterase